MKEKIIEIINKYKILIIIVFLIIITIVIFYLNIDVKAEVKESDFEIKENKEIEEVKSTFKVDIKGAVITPGVYELTSGSRVLDVINMAGGLNENANTSIINLSKLIEDEMVIYIYSNAEIEEYMKSKEVIKIEYVYLEKECICPDNINDACSDEVYVSEDKLKEEKESDTTDSSKININSASKESLMELSGIGESKAESIIEYRNKNKFTNIEQIMDISGFGESIFKKIKDSITI